jgi:hypothetical protein
LTKELLNIYPEYMIEERLSKGRKSLLTALKTNDSKFEKVSKVNLNTWLNRTHRSSTPESKVAGDFGDQEFQVTAGSNRSESLRHPRVTGDSDIQAFRVTPAARS